MKHIWDSSKLVNDHPGSTFRASFDQPCWIIESKGIFLAIKTILNLRQSLQGRTEAIAADSSHRVFAEKALLVSDLDVRRRSKASIFNFPSKARPIYSPTKSHITTMFPESERSVPF